MNILFTICGRAGSKGIKNKNIRNFLGYKLPLYTLSAIDLYIRRHPENKCDIAVNSDSKELLDILSIKTDIYKIERNENLAGDMIPKMVVIQIVCFVHSQLIKRNMIWSSIWILLRRSERSKMSKN